MQKARFAALFLATGVAILLPIFASAASLADSGISITYTSQRNAQGAVIGTAQNFYKNDTLIDVIFVSATGQVTSTSGATSLANAGITVRYTNQLNAQGAVIGTAQEFYDASGNLIDANFIAPNGTITTTAPAPIFATNPSPSRTGTGISSASSGLVPCGAASGDQATECQACDLVSLTQNVIMFLIGIAIPIAVAMFAYAGILYFSSGIGGSEYISRAKGIFRSTLFGFIVAVAAWLIINTILYTVLDRDQYPNSSWFHIDCSVNRTIVDNRGISGVLQGTLGVAPTPVELPAGPSITPACPTDYYMTPGGACIDRHGRTTTALVTYNGAPATKPISESSLQAKIAATNQYKTALSAVCASEGLSNCQLAQAVMAIESSGNAGANSPAGAIGLMQLMPSTARGLDPSLRSLSDSQIRQRLTTDTTLNMKLGVRYLNQLENTFGNSLSNTIAAYNGGPGANTASRTCQGQTYWECTANEGYAETRNYVPNVISAMNLLN